MAHNTPYKPLIDMAITHLKEQGVLHKLHIKWWKQKRGNYTVLHMFPQVLFWVGNQPKNTKKSFFACFLSLRRTVSTK